MNTKKIIGIISAIVIVIAVTLGAILIPKSLNKDKELPNANGDNAITKPKETQKPVDKENTTEKPVTTPEKPSKDFSDDFKGSTADTDIEGFSKEDVDKAFETVSEYVHTKMFDPYMVSGQWVTDGSANINPVLILGGNVSDEIVDHLNQLDTRKANLADEVGRYMFYLDPTGEYKGSKACLSELQETEIKYTGENSCTQNIRISNIEYNANKADNVKNPLIEFNFDVAADILVEDKNGKEFYTTVEYDHQLFLAKNVDNLKDKSPYMIYESTPQVSINAPVEAGK